MCGYPVFPAPFVKEAVNVCFWLFCQESDGFSFIGLFLGLLFYSVGLHVCFHASVMLILFLWLCCILGIFVIPQTLLFLPQIGFSIWGLLYFHINFGLIFLF
jgi:hypothetical protein